MNRLFLTFRIGLRKEQLLFRTHNVGPWCGRGSLYEDARGVRWLITNVSRGLPIKLWEGDWVMSHTVFGKNITGFTDEEVDWLQDLYEKLNWDPAEKVPLVNSKQEPK